jgi:hypothetical protein
VERATIAGEKIAEEKTLKRFPFISLLSVLGDLGG